MNILCSLVTFYIYILFARVIVSFVFVFRPQWTPSEGVRSVLQVIYALTDPPVEFLRRFIPPLRSGAMALDLAFLAWFVIVEFVIRRIVCSGI